MKFTEVYEHLVAGKDLLLDGKLRVRIGCSQPDHFYVHVTDCGTQGLPWLHRNASHLEPAPRELPELPRGFMWGSCAACYVASVSGDFIEHAATEGTVAAHKERAKHYRKQAGIYSDLAAVYEALVKEFETR